jgi:hypothetical protein
VKYRDLSMTNSPIKIEALTVTPASLVKALPRRLSQGFNGSTENRSGHPVPNWRLLDRVICSDPNRPVQAEKVE